MTETASRGRVHELQVEELQQAEEFWLRFAQRDAFSKELGELQEQEQSEDGAKRVVRDSHIRRLCPFLDQEGFIRVGGRLQRADLPFETRHPLLLPEVGAVTKLIVRECHEDGDHQLGTEHSLAELRRRFWIISGREVIKKLISKCPECKRRRKKPEEQIMAAKLEAQVRPSFRAFAKAAVDFAGPFETKQGRAKARMKRYLCLFTCLQTRCVHLEIAYGLDTDSFLCALSRFTARRGVPEEMWSDNGRNFVRADKEIQKMCQSLDKEKISKHFNKESLKWHFNPPAAPHFGGAYESMIKIVKRNLYRTLQQASLTDEELQTAFCQAEAMVNSRPLTPVSSDPQDGPPLTPAHFLLGNIRTEIDPDADGTQPTHQRRWRRLQQLSQLFWRRWILEYLPTLQPRTKWSKPSPDLQVDDVVPVMDPSTPRGQWPLGRVTRVSRGEDGRVRVAEVRCRGKMITRPVVKLIRLEKASER